MRKKGFTLVELLAVIVILAIVALISTPIILGVVETSRKRAFEDSGYGIVEAIKNYYIEDMQDGTVDYKTWTFPEAEGLKFEGMRPSGGNARLNGDGTIELAFHDNSFCATKGSGEDKITVTKYVEGKCALEASYMKKNFMEGSSKNKHQISKIEFASTRNVPKDAIESWDASAEVDGSVFAWLQEDKEGYYKLTIGGNGEVYAPENSSELFDDFHNVEEMNLENLNTSQVTNMSQMFDNCYNLTKLDVSSFDTSKVINMSYMFSSCSSLISLDLRNFNTSNVTGMSGMFSSCGSLITLDLSNFDTSSVTSMSGMFSMCTSLTNLDLSKFKTNKVNSMSSMFAGCYRLSNLNISNFDTSNVINMSSMFKTCYSLTELNLDHFNTDKVISMESMFYLCSDLTTLNLSSFNTKQVTNMRLMFYSCDNLITLDLSNFDTSSVTDVDNIFRYCSESIQVKTNNKTKDWILNLSSSGRPSSWNDQNFIIV